MGILQPSEPRELPEVLKWSYRKVGPCLHRGPFMLAAPPLGFECHHPLRRTYPCYRELKGCTLACPFCRYKKQYTAYVPLLDLNEAKRFKIVVTGGKKTWNDVKALEVGTLLGMNRGELQRDTLRFFVWPEAILPAVFRDMRRKCVDDISPYLFHLWQRRELTEHFGQRYYASLLTQSNETPHTDARDDEQTAPGE